MAKSVNDFLYETLRFKNIVAAEQSAEAYLMQESLTLLNDIILSWGGTGLTIPYQSVVDFNTTANLELYTFGEDVSYTVNTSPIINIIQGFITLNNVRYALFEGNEKNYSQIGYTLINAIPRLYFVRVYPDYTEVRFNPIPNQIMAVTFVCKQRLAQLALNDDITQIPSNWYRSLKYLLAYELCQMYGKVIDPLFQRDVDNVMRLLESMNPLDLTIQKRELIGKRGRSYARWGAFI